MQMAYADEGVDIERQCMACGRACTPHVTLVPQFSFFPAGALRVLYDLTMVSKFKSLKHRLPSRYPPKALRHATCYRHTHKTGERLLLLRLCCITSCLSLPSLHPRPFAINH